MLNTGTNTLKRKRTSAEVGGGTTEHNNGPPTDIVTVNGGDNGDNISRSSDNTCSTISTTTGNRLYEAQKCHFGKTISLFMKKNMGRMPFCCDYEDAIQLVDIALQKDLLVCPVVITSIDFKMKLTTLFIKANKELRTTAQAMVKGGFQSTFKLRMRC